MTMTKDDKEKLPIGYMTLPNAKRLLRSTIGHVRQLAQDGELAFVRDKAEAVIGVAKADVERLIPPKAPKPPKVTPLPFKGSEEWGKR